MKLKKNHALPVLMMCIALALSVVLIVLPVEQILVTYKVVNGVKTVEYVSKAEGIFRIIAVSLGCGCAWIFLKNRMEKKCTAEPNMLSYRFRSFGIDIFFFALTLLPSVMSILSILLWIRRF